MAKPIKRASGRWYIQIQVGVSREAKSFDTKREAQDWAARRAAELRIDCGDNPGSNKTLADALRRYAGEIVPDKRGERFEFYRLNAMLSDDMFPHRKLIQRVLPDDIAAWRDARLNQVSKSTVLRELNIISHVFEVARREWRWVSGNPVSDVRRPSAPPHRDVVISLRQQRKMLREMGWRLDRPVRSVGQAVAACFIAALQTGMRAGELCGLRWVDVCDNYCILRAEKTKTGKGREVPLTKTALRNIEAMRGWDDSLVFGIKSASLDALFRKYRTRADLSGFTFHDSRHTAATRLAQHLHVLDLCKMFGWANTTRALTYYNPTGADIARRLTESAPILKSR